MDQQESQDQQTGLDDAIKQEGGTIDDSYASHAATDGMSETVNQEAIEPEVETLVDDQGKCQVGGSNELVIRNVDTHELSKQAGFEIKPDGKSNKYPLLKVYYEFGPWVGRNRKAICVRCKYTSASSQPERLIRHLRKCVALNEEDRKVAEELLLVSNANKKKNKRQALELASAEDETDYFATDNDDNNKSALVSSVIALSSPGPKRLKRDHPDRKNHIDQCLVRFILCNRIPLKSIHSKEFIEFVRSLDPEYRLPSREIITNTLIPGLLKI